MVFNLRVGNRLSGWCATAGKRYLKSQHGAIISDISERVKLFVWGLVYRYLSKRSG